MYRERERVKTSFARLRENERNHVTQKRNHRDGRELFFSVSRVFSECSRFLFFFLSYSLAREWKISEGRMRNSKWRKKKKKILESENAYTRIQLPQLDARLNTHAIANPKKYVPAHWKNVRPRIIFKYVPYTIKTLEP